MSCDGLIAFLFQGICVLCSRHVSEPKRGPLRGVSNDRVVAGKKIKEQIRVKQNRFTAILNLGLQGAG